MMLARTSEPSKRKEIVFDRHLLLHLVDWIDEDRLVISSRQISPPGGRLWTVRIDPRTLEVTAPLSPITSWSGFVIWDFKVHHAKHAISISGQTSNLDIRVGAVQPGSHALREVRTLSLAESNDFPSCWATDNRTLVFTSDRSGHWGVYAQDAVGDSPAVPLTASATRTDWPQLASRGTELLYWSAPDEGPPSLLRALFDGAPVHDPVSLFTAPDLGNPLGSHMAMRCPMKTSDCILRWATTAEAAGWYRLDPRDGTRTRIDGLPTVVPRNTAGADFWDVAPDGETLATASGERVDFFALKGNDAVLTNSSALPLSPTAGALAALTFDPAGDGVFIATAASGGGDVSFLSKAGRLARVHANSERSAYLDTIVISPDGSRAAFALNRVSDGVWSVDEAF